MQNLLRLQFPPTASQTHRDREISLSIGMETKSDKFFYVDMIRVLKKKKKKRANMAAQFAQAAAALTPD